MMLTLKDSRRRFFPDWVRFTLAGFVTSVLIGLAHWAACEVGWLARPTRQSHWDDVSGEHLLRRVHVFMYPGESDPNTAPSVIGNFDMIGYGWPAHGLGAFFKSVNVFNPSQRIRPVIGINLRPLWAFSPLASPYERIMPVFPMFGQTIVNTFFWGGLLWAFFALREKRRRRRERIVRPCRVCGYDIVGLTRSNKCPECGTATQPRSILNSRPKASS